MPEGMPRYEAAHAPIRSGAGNLSDLTEGSGPQPSYLAAIGGSSNYVSIRLTFS